MTRSPLARGIRAIAVVAAAALAAGPVHADRPVAEVGLLGGLVFPDDDVVGTGPGADDIGLGLGLHANWFLHDNWALFADGLFAPMDGSRFGSVTSKAFRAGPRLFVPSVSENIQFFADAGFGWNSMGLDDAESVSRPFVSAGFGQRFLFGQQLTAHWELRWDRTFDRDETDAIPGDFGQGHALIGLGWRFGGSAEPIDPDTDRDGVRDSQDACPDTPRGAKVDARGCPSDSDGDGVFDGLDKCPDTPRGWPVDAKGCPQDSDGDGVPDGKDECPGTPRGTAVDEKGCAKPARLFVPDETGQTKALILEGVNFEYNSADLTPGSRTVLDRVAESMVAWPDVTVEVGGHTDSDGRAEYNQALSQWRPRTSGPGSTSPRPRARR